MQIKVYQPDEIEKRSFEILSSELTTPLDPQNELVIKRVIHTSADFDYAQNLFFSPDVVKNTIEALKMGADIITDTQMAKAGINKKVLAGFGGQVHCFMSDEDVAAEAKTRGITRATVCMERAAALGKRVVFAIGNAPTALIAIDEQVKANRLDPICVIGVPVGFVNVVESKEQLIQSNLPCIVARGRKGGSNVAAAICNALLYQARDQEQDKSK